MRASASFNFDDGIRTSSWNAVFAFRKRVSMSAIGSVIVTVAPPPLPRRLRDARDFTGVRHLPQADAAQAEVAVDGSGSTAAAAARVRAHLELRLALRLVDQCFLCHRITPGLDRRVGTGNRTLAVTRAPGRRLPRTSRS